MDNAYARPDYGVSSCFLFCFWLIWSGFFNLNEESIERMQRNWIYEKISKEISWILRHSGWTHAQIRLDWFDWKQVCTASDNQDCPVIQRSQIPPARTFSTDNQHVASTCLYHLL